MKHAILIWFIAILTTILAKAQDVPYRVGGDVSAPRIVWKVDPKYTD